MDYRAGMVIEVYRGLQGYRGEEDCRVVRVPRELTASLVLWGKPHL